MIHRDISGNEIPAGKVTRSLESSFMEGTVPGWITTTGDATASVGSLDSSDPYLGVEVSSGMEGIEGPSVDLTQFKEVRWGMVATTTVQKGVDTEGWDMGLTDGNDGANLSLTNADLDDGATLRTFDSGATNDTDLNWDWMLNGGLVYSELRIRPQSGEVAVFAGGGDDVVYYDESPAMSVGTVNTRVRVETADTDKINIRKLWLRLIE